jgi:hypothetical protein
MNMLPHRAAEWNRAVVRVLAICICLATVVFFWTGHIADLDQTYRLGLWRLFHHWQVTSLWVATVLASVLISWSLFLVLSSRDLRFGAAGLAVGLASLGLWLLFSRAVPR